MKQQQPVLSRAALSSSSESLLTSSAGEERPSEDEGIKGKIRKSSARSTKRRIKFFSSVTWRFFFKDQIRSGVKLSKLRFKTYFFSLSLHVVLLFLTLFCGSVI